MAHQTFIVKRRILDRGNLWGVIAESQTGESWTIGIEKLLSMINVEKIPFVCDYPGADRPATLTVVHKLVKDGMIYFFRTVSDKTKRNNFNKVKTISCRSKLPQRWS